ncbi:MAG: hypothetical protein J6R20_01650 [Clostridia bacterium]|jgi:hypothetical protein|nr:hypothetical protein [Clostridia bacterium]
MKKLTAVLIAVLMSMLILASCGANQDETETIVSTTARLPSVTDISGEEFFVVTDAQGNAQRDKDGNILLYAVDAQGNPIADVTEAKTLDGALKVGNRIEMPRFRITLSEGWADARSSSDVNIGNLKTLDMIAVSVTNDVTAEEKIKEVDDTISSVRKRNDSAVVESEEITVCGENAVYKSVSVNNETMSVYLGYVVFTHGEDVYYCRMTADRNISPEEISEMIDILKTIEFIS